MPSFIGHIAAGSALGYSVYEGKKNFRFWIVIFFLSIFPDFDVVTFLMGVPYQSLMGHRGMFHSFLFVLLTSTIIAYHYNRIVRLPLMNFFRTLSAFGIVAISHPLLDTLTNGGLGVRLFFPFIRKRFLSPWRPIEVSPVGIKQFFSERGIDILLNEVIYIVLPSLLLILSVLIIRAYKRRKSRIA